MTDDHRELIEMARQWHYTPATASGEFLCFGCTKTGRAVTYPCLTARLADALDVATRPDSTENHRTSYEACNAALAATEAKAERILDAYHQSYRHGPDPDPRRCPACHAAALEAP